MKESTIESKVCAYAKSKGILVMKLAGPNQNGQPDKLFLKDGKAMFIEFKKPGEEPTPLQKRWMRDLRRRKFRATWVDNVDDGKHEIDMWLLLDFN